MLPLIPVPDIQQRLSVIFPEGTAHRANCVSLIAARIVFVMLYIDAVEGADVWLRPSQVARMTDAQAKLGDDAARGDWRTASLSPGTGEIPGRWYASDTRESIRDDSLRMGLIAIGAVIEKAGLATTSPAGRYALQSAFAALMNPTLSGAALEKAIHAWQTTHLNAAALARIVLLRRGTSGGDPVLVKFPNGETRRMAPGPSSLLSKAAIEDFAPRFLKQPALLWLSESATKVVERDDVLAKSIGIVIEPDRNLPDIILVDLGRTPPQLVFVEVVATDGPVTVTRKAALLELSNKAGFAHDHVSFVTVFADRGDAAFKKAVPALAWGAYAWFMSEPDNLIELVDAPRWLT
ncbi:MAG: BsuBIPstI restriction endonuclease domain-containing protein [Alphaproteobacteria bacterium]|nr:MAG: BsuBIPstI restriction endonuclease domain-containing protein [Caulobacteraceae bacterium]TPW07569.1 MAG: BsuBIPstI restriction endonuclease domain-containing protein [Alphaproteobacteria bacterium]